MTKTHLVFRAVLMLAAAFGALAAPAAGPAIGMAVANGSFQLDRAPITGNATLFDGSTVETAASPLQIQLNGGQRLRFSTETRARVFGKKVVLESGFGQFEAAPGYEVEARTLRISAATADTVTRIRLASGRKVMVAAVRGSVRVTNAAGLLVMTVPTGESYDFEPQAAAPPPAPAGGAGASQGAAGASQAGSAGGGAGSSGAGAGGAGAGGAGAGGAGAAGTAAAGTAAATGTGIGVGATVAIVGGVAVGATVGGLAAVGSLPGQGDDTPSASR